VLVIGVGSELRGDDAAGRRAADALAEIGLPGVDARSVHQLTPELAVELADRRLVLVVDASVDVDAVTVRAVVRPTSRASAATGVMTHHLDPAALVGLASLFGSLPEEVVTVGIPAHDLDLGTELSAGTAGAVDVAVAELVARCWRAVAR
jgi:hydrogenase maturation protease